MQNNLALSLIVIVKNEEKDIADCLKSVDGLTNEVIVLDSGSTDRTVEICTQHGATVFHQPFLGFGPQKQAALGKAKGPWVLNLDADERVTPALKEEIRQFLVGEKSKTDVAGMKIPFHHFFLGKHLRFGGVAGERHIRLFRKDNGAYGDNPIHEGITVKGPIGKMREPIIHQSYQDTTDYLEKCNNYTSLIAEKKFKEGKRFHFWHHLRLPFEFIARYVVKLGFLDGSPGFIYAMLSSYYVWLKFVKLRDREANLS